MKKVWLSILLSAFIHTSMAMASYDKVKPCAIAEAEKLEYAVDDFYSLVKKIKDGCESIQNKTSVYKTFCTRDKKGKKQWVRTTIKRFHAKIPKEDPYIVYEQLYNCPKLKRYTSYARRYANKFYWYYVDTEQPYFDTE